MKIEDVKSIDFSNLTDEQINKIADDLATMDQKEITESIEYILDDVYKNTEEPGVVELNARKLLTHGKIKTYTEALLNASIDESTNPTE